MATLKEVLGTDEVVLVAALALITTGLWLLADQAALLAPGFALLWIGLPSRMPFIVQPGVFPRSTKRRKKNDQ